MICEGPKGDSFDGSGTYVLSVFVLADEKVVLPIVQAIRVRQTDSLEGLLYVTHHPVRFVSAATQADHMTKLKTQTQNTD